MPIGPVPAGTPIPVQPLPANSGFSTTVTVRVDFAISANGTVSAESVQGSSGSTIVDNAALQIVKTTPFKSIDTNCDGAPVRQGFIDVTFSPNAIP